MTKAATPFWRLCLFAPTLLLAAPLHAQENSSTALAGANLKVAVKVVPPFVMKTNNAFSGFSIDLWNTIAQVSGAHAEFVETESMDDLLDGVASKRADLAIAAISITAGRAAKFDFSQPIFDSGLQILTRADASGGAVGFGAILGAAMSGPLRNLIATLFAVVFVLAHLIWFFDRKHEESLKPYFPGIFRAAYWAFGASGGQQPFTPHSPFGRALGALCVFTSVMIVGFFTASVTSALTIEGLRGEINGPEDLPGKKVGTVAGSTSAAYLRDAKVRAKEYPNLDRANEALLASTVDAVVYDAPALLYYAANAGKGKVAAVGAMFHPEAYGVLYPAGSELRRPLDAALLQMRENGAYTALYRKWFQSQSGN